MLQKILQPLKMTNVAEILQHLKMTYVAEILQPLKITNAAAFKDEILHPLVML